jgi:hypothetical protein
MGGLMNRKWMTLWAVLFSLSGAWGRELSPMAPPEADPTAGKDITIDTWQPKGPVRPPPPEPEPPAPTPSAAKPGDASKTDEKPSDAKPAAAKPADAKASEAKPAVAEPATPRIKFNEMAGSITAIDPYEKTIRIYMEGGFSPQFPYDKQTVVLVNGQKLKVADLQTTDYVVVRYLGKDMTAREIEKTAKPASAPK